MDVLAPSLCFGFVITLLGVSDNLNLLMSSVPSVCTECVQSIHRAALRSRLTSPNLHCFNPRLTGDMSLHDRALVFTWNKLFH